MAEYITIENNAHFERLLTTDPDFRRRTRKLVRKGLNAARKMTSAGAKVNLKNDPRQSYKAVKASVYKKILGGNVSILRKKRASNVRVNVQHSSTRKSPRGGNRRSRSSNTERIDSYYGADRNFILNFINSGAKKGGGNRSTRYGNRGSIQARGWFGNVSRNAVVAAANEFCVQMDNEIRKTKV